MITHPTLGDFRILSVLGAGSTSKVYLAQSLAHGFKVAIKKLRVEVNEMREVEITQHAICPLVVEIFDVFEDKDGEKCILMEYVEGESLLSYIKSQGELCVGELRDLFTQMIYVLKLLHDKKSIVHRDIKLENILLDSNSNIRVIDFGFATDKSVMLTYCGSPPYAAPELILRKPYTKAVDVWALGIVLYAMVAGHLPFTGNNIQHLFGNILNQDIVMPENVTDELWDLLQGMLKKDPEERLTVDQVFNHPWVTGETRLCLDRRSPESVSLDNMVTSFSDSFDMDYENEIYHKNTDLVTRIRLCIDRHNKFNTGNPLYDKIHQNRGLYSSKTEAKFSFQKDASLINSLYKFGDARLRRKSITVHVNPLSQMMKKIPNRVIPVSAMLIKKF